MCSKTEAHKGSAEGNRLRRLPDFWQAAPKYPTIALQGLLALLLHPGPSWSPGTHKRDITEWCPAGGTHPQATTKVCGATGSWPVGPCNLLSPCSGNRVPRTIGG